MSTEVQLGKATQRRSALQNVTGALSLNSYRCTVLHLILHSWSSMPSTVNISIRKHHCARRSDMSVCNSVSSWQVSRINVRVLHC